MTSETGNVTDTGGSRDAVRRPASGWGPALGLAISIALLAILADQAAKAAVVSWLGPSAGTHRWEFAGSWLAFEYVENTGAAFGIFRGRTWLLSVMALVIVGWFVIAYGRSLPYSRALQVAVGLIVGGALGNLVDRLRLGYVIDYLAVGIWPRFNVADSAITIGLVVLFLTVAREETGRGSMV